MYRLKYIVCSALYNYRNLIKCFFSGMGIILTTFSLIVMCYDHPMKTILNVFPPITSNHIFVTLVLITLIFSIYKTRQRWKFKYRLDNIDSFIEVNIGDIFTIKGKKVIPINNHMDLSLNGKVKNSNSLQEQVIKRMPEINDSKSFNITDKKDLGYIESFDDYLFVVNSYWNSETNIVSSSFNDLNTTLLNFWTNVHKKCNRSTVLIIPLLSTNYGSNDQLNRDIVIKIIISSYVVAAKKKTFDKVIICIHPHDVKNNNIDLTKIEKYLKFACENFKKLDIIQLEK